jgi:hypothetical protein
MKTMTAVLVMAMGCKGTEQREAPKPKEEPASKSDDEKSEKKPQKKDAPPKPVEAKALLAEYGENEVKGDESYKGKRLRLHGLVGDIKKDLDDVPYVTVGTGAELELPIAQCYFADGVEGLGELKPKQSITVDCKCDGVMLNVIMRDCSFAPSVALTFCQTLEAAGAVVKCKASGNLVGFGAKGSKEMAGFVAHYDAAVFDAALVKMKASEKKDFPNMVGSPKTGIIVRWKTGTAIDDKKIRDALAAE